jgi:hypothetical protein
MDVGENLYPGASGVVINAVTLGALEIPPYQLLTVQLDRLPGEAPVTLEAAARFFTPYKFEDGTHAVPDFAYNIGLRPQDYSGGVDVLEADAVYDRDGQEAIEPMHLFAQPYNEWLSLCGQTIPSGGATIEVYGPRRNEYCPDCLAEWK